MNPGRCPICLETVIPTKPVALVLAYLFACHSDPELAEGEEPPHFAFAFAFAFGLAFLLQSAQKAREPSIGFTQDSGHYHE